MFNARRNLKWLWEVKGSIVRGKLRVQNISSRIKRETQQEIFSSPRGNFYFYGTHRRQKNKIKSAEKRRMAKIKTIQENETGESHKDEF